MTEVQMVFYGSCPISSSVLRKMTWVKPWKSKNGERWHQTLTDFASTCKTKFEISFFPRPRCTQNKKRETDQTFFIIDRRKSWKLKKPCNPFWLYLVAFASANRLVWRLLGILLILSMGMNRFLKSFSRPSTDCGRVCGSLTINQFSLLWKKFLKQSAKCFTTTQIQQQNSAMGRVNWLKSTLITNPATFSKFCNKCKTSLFPVALKFDLGKGGY